MAASIISFSATVNHSFQFPTSPKLKEQEAVLQFHKFKSLFMYTVSCGEQMWKVLFANFRL